MEKSWNYAELRKQQNAYETIVRHHKMRELSMVMTTPKQMYRLLDRNNYAWDGQQWKERQ